MCPMGALFYEGDKMELKKPTTFNEQVKLLKKKNIIIIKKYQTDISLKHLDFPYRWKSMLKQ